ncbi:hypothetical protein ACHAQA_000058 [Verticillium albo-atrum]
MRQTTYSDADLKYWQCMNNIEPNDQDEVACEKWNDRDSTTCSNSDCLCPRKSGSLAMGRDESVGVGGVIGKYTSQDTVEFNEIAN